MLKRIVLSILLLIIVISFFLYRTRIFHLFKDEPSSYETVHVMPRIENYTFGELCIDNRSYQTDIIITAQGEIKQRDTKYTLTFQSRHTISLEEIVVLCEEEPEVIIIGTGEHGRVRLSQEAEQYLQKQQIEIIIGRTPVIIEKYNKCTKKKIAWLHPRC